MTAVASAQSFPPLARGGWAGAGSGQPDVNGMSAEDVSRMFVPRKSAQRSNSSSSLSSQSSTSSTSSTSTLNNGVQNGELTWSARKKPSRGLWPSSKAEPATGVPNARPQMAVAQSNGLVSSSGTTSLPASQHGSQTGQPQNMPVRNQGAQDATAVLYLLPMNGTFERKTITVPFAPELLRIGRQTNAKTVPTPMNGFFDSKVLSRQHAEIWAEKDGKVWIRDVKSSNGTFVNGKRLSPENRESEPHVLKEQDVLELGIDIVSEDQKTVVHHKVAARVEHAGLFGVGSNGMDLSFGELDSSTGNGHLVQSGGTRSRSSSHGSMNNTARFANGLSTTSNTFAAAPYHAKWLQPVTMEQIVKRLHAELKQARLQAQDLHHTENYVEAVLRDQHPLPPQPPLFIPPAKHADAKVRFPTEPPAPPPQQPLPEKPDGANLKTRTSESPSQPPLRRTNTERPREVSVDDGTHPAKNESSSQILSLVDALSAAQKQISTQSARLKQMEEALNMEREARSHAEERVVVLESSSQALSSLQNGFHKPPTVDADASAQAESTDPIPIPASTDTPDWHHRLDQLRAEVEEMRAQMDHHRRRAEAAEAENKRSRTTLAAMVEQIRRRDEAASGRGRRADRANGHARAPLTHASGVDALASSGRDKTERDPEGDHTDRNLDIIDDSDAKTSSQWRDSTTESNADIDIDMHGAVKALSEPEFEALATMLSRAGVLDPLSSSSSSQPGARARHDKLMQSAPYASILGVVLLGVGMMAYLNGWQRVVER